MQDVYASEEESAAVLMRGCNVRNSLLAYIDMFTTAEVKTRLEISGTALQQEIDRRNLIAIKDNHTSYFYPKWQFEPQVFPHIRKLFAELDTKDSWYLYTFMVTKHVALDNKTPLSTLLNDNAIDRVFQLAKAESH